MHSVRRHCIWLLVIGVAVGVFGISYRPAVAACDFKTVEPAAGDEPVVEDAVDAPCHVTKHGDKIGVCRTKSSCTGDDLCLSPSSCMGSSVSCCFPPSGADGDKSSGAPSCSDGTKKGTCSTTCPVADRITATCSGGDFCCTSSGGAGGDGGTSSGTSGVDVSVPNPTGFTSLQSFLATGILPWLRGIIITLAMIFFIIGALLYTTGGGDEGNIKKGKAAMTAALIGLALGIAAPTFLHEIYALFGVSGGPASPSAVQIALNVLKFLLSLVGILTMIMLIVSGLSWMASAGDDSRAKTAKSMATSAVIGLTLAMAALIIVRQIAKFFM